MNVYTEPQSTTYLLWHTFIFASEDGEGWAISVPNSIARLLSTGYTLLIIYLFNSLWNFILYIVMMSLPAKDGLAWNHVLSVFWNSPEPLSAMANMWITYERMCLHSSRHFKFGSRPVQLAGGLTLLALLMTLASIAGGIVIIPSMVLGNGAPANPQAVWVPAIGELGSLFSRYSMIKSPAAIRAIGSAEASKVTLRDKVSIYQERTERSTTAQPDFMIRYHYNLTGPELGIAKSLELRHSVRGKCVTEYDWLKHSNSTPYIDYYRPWNRSDIDTPTPSNTGPNMFHLGFKVEIHPDQVKSAPQNISFALMFQTGHLLSFSESSDAMYMTERIPDGLGSNMTHFRVKAGRPLLSCWQESTMCVRGRCGAVEASLTNGLSPGLSMLLAQLQLPQVISLGNHLGPATLMSFFSPTPGGAIDAASSSTFADMERLILGAYLLSRNMLRDATMVDPVSGFKNAALDSKGQQLPGVGDFMLEVGSVTALSMTALIVIPLVTSLLGIILAICNRMSHPRKNTSFLRTQRDRMVAFAMPQLFRAANMVHGSNAKWDFVSHMHPIPTNEAYGTTLTTAGINEGDEIQLSDL